MVKNGAASIICQRATTALVVLLVRVRCNLKCCENINHEGVCGWKVKLTILGNSIELWKQLRVVVPSLPSLDFAEIDFWEPRSIVALLQAQRTYSKPNHTTSHNKGNHNNTTPHNITRNNKVSHQVKIWSIQLTFHLRCSLTWWCHWLKALETGWWFNRYTTPRTRWLTLTFSRQVWKVLSRRSRLRGRKARRMALSDST